MIDAQGYDLLTDLYICIITFLVIYYVIAGHRACRVCNYAAGTVVGFGASIGAFVLAAAYL